MDLLPAQHGWAGCGRRSGTMMMDAGDFSQRHCDHHHRPVQVVFDRLVYDLYGLTEEEIKIVEAE